MKPSYAMSMVVGAVVGLVGAIVAFLLIGAMGGVPSLDPAIDTGSVEPVFSIAASTLWSLTIIAGAGTGIVLAVVTKAVARVIDPEAAANSLLIIAPLGAVVGAVVGIVVFPLGSGIVGTIAQGTVTVTVTDMIVMVAIAGTLGGAAVVWQSYILSRPPEHKLDPDLLAA
jgi:hypothetical protein